MYLLAGVVINRGRLVSHTNATSSLTEKNGRTGIHPSTAASSQGSICEDNIMWICRKDE